MRWHDFDRNGKIDSRDYYLMNEFLKSNEEEEKEDKLFSDYNDNDESDNDDLW